MEGGRAGSNLRSKLSLNVVDQGQLPGVPTLHRVQPVSITLKRVSTVLITLTLLLPLARPDFQLPALLLLLLLARLLHVDFPLPDLATLSLLIHLFRRDYPLPDLVDAPRLPYNQGNEWRWQSWCQ